VAAALCAGCAGPEKKLGRGIQNSTEFARMGEMGRSVEQTALWHGPESAYTTGVIKGFNRSIVRTAVGLHELVTFPFPPYEPYAPHKVSVKPVYPDSYKPNLIEDQLFSPDTSLGFGGGDVAPFIPGSRFRIFDN
jgi:putative exosortase-associated protein (TIGR04073 family)